MGVGVNAKRLSDTAQAWYGKGDHLEIPNTAATRIWRQGAGPAVVCLHGVPASAYLYRKVLPELAQRGLEGITLDFPGMGFADRPTRFDYSWTGLSAWLEQALNAAGIDNFHLVVHDIGGPIGFDLVRRIPQRIQSLTVLNTLTYVSRFEKPWVMRPFSVPLLGLLWTLQIDSPGIVPFFRWKGVTAGPSYAEIRAYGEILRLTDGGQAFRNIMSGFDTTQAFEDRILPTLRERQFPAQIIWGEQDAELSLETYGADAKQALGLTKEIFVVNGKHFLQETAYVEIAERIAHLVRQGVDI